MTRHPSSVFPGGRVVPSQKQTAPGLNGNILLAYPGKASDGLAHIPPLHLRAGKVYGQSRFDGWTNKLILAENLAALRALRDDRAVAGKIRLIYIDPPFSTNQEFRKGLARTATVSASSEDRRAYEDYLVGAEYVEFLRQRLLLLKDLLADDGSIYLHIDWKMGHYVKVLMDEIFGQDHFINDIARIKCNPKNFERKAYGNIKDMILFYSKGDDTVWNESREQMEEEDIVRLFPKVDDEGRRYTTTPLHAPGETRNGPTGQPWKGLQPPVGRHWRNDPNELTRLDALGLIEWSSTGNPRKRIYADEVMKSGKKRQDVWWFKDPAYPSYPTEKNRRMMETIIQASSNPDDLVLDCFAGSGTTLLAAELHGRRWIGIDNSPLAVRAARRKLLDTKEVRAFTVIRARKTAPVGSK